VKHKEFIQKLSEQLKFSKTKTATYSNRLIQLILQTASRENVQIDGFGEYIYRPGKSVKFQPDARLIKEINIK